ncbi:hypothetical protein C3L33_13627, partial [Rhododendron williamsianum]
MFHHDLLGWSKFLLEHSRDNHNKATKEDYSRILDSLQDDDGEGYCNSVVGLSWMMMTRLSDDEGDHDYDSDIDLSPPTVMQNSMAEYVNCIEELSPRSVWEWDETHINQVVADGVIQFDLFDRLREPQLLDLLRKYVNGELPRDSGLAPYENV